MYAQERKRVVQTSSPIKEKIGFKQGLKLWLNQWRLSSIKKTWNNEYSRTMGNYNRNIGKVQDFGRKF